MRRYLLYFFLASLVLLTNATIVPSRADVAVGATGLRITMQRIMTKGASMNAVAGYHQPRSSEDPITAELMAGKQREPQPTSESRSAAEGWMTYADPTNGFSIAYPHGFVVQSQDVSKLYHFTPVPVASVFFMNPTMASGDLAGIEPPDLEVRVYTVRSLDSLKQWLVSVGFVSNEGGTSDQPYHGASVNGLKVCRSTMIAPGCSIYVLGNGRVYQLTPISSEGEAMLDTFSLLPRVQ
jgi:hypothetical protein